MREHDDDEGEGLDELEVDDSNDDDEGNVGKEGERKASLCECIEKREESQEDMHP